MGPGLSVWLLFHNFLHPGTALPALAQLPMCLNTALTFNALVMDSANSRTQPPSLCQVFECVCPKKKVVVVVVKKKKKGERSVHSTWGGMGRGTALPASAATLCWDCVPAARCPAGTAAVRCCQVLHACWRGALLSLLPCFGLECSIPLVAADDYGN